MAKLLISPEAVIDLLEIWLYIAENSPENADRFQDKLTEKAKILSESSEVGMDRPELGQNLKSFPVDRYLLYYRSVQTGIELVRVLHGSRDIQILF